MRYEVHIARRHLMSMRHRFLSALTILAIAGVAIGVTAYTSVVSVATGFVDSFRDRALGVNPHIVVTKYGVFFSEYELVESALRQIPGVESTAPFVLQEMLTTAPNSAARVCSDRAAPSAPGVFLTVSGERAPSVALWSVRGGIGEEPGRRGVTMRASNRVNEPRPSPRPVQEGLTTEAGRQTTGVFLG